MNKGTDVEVTMYKHKIALANIEYSKDKLQH